MINTEEKKKERKKYATPLFILLFINKLINIPYLK